MNTEKMTVHQALCELKTLDKRISKAISEVNPIAVKDHGSAKVNSMSLDEFKTVARGSHDSVMALIRRQIALKAAINEYNSTAKISVCGSEYTIAQAIWLMQHGMDHKKTLLDCYTRILTNATNRMERANGDELTKRAETFAISMYGGKDKADPKDFTTTMEDYITRHTLEMVDPIGLRDIIKALEKEISDFESNVDSAIQVANATHTIEIEY